MMIGEKQPFADGPTPNEEPPSYEIDQYSSTNVIVKPADNLVSSSSTPHQPQPSQSPDPPPLKVFNTRSDKGKSWSLKDWFTIQFTTRTAYEVRSTVSGLVRDLVQENTSNSRIATRVLQCCADACMTQHVSLSDILQQKFIEGHTPIYWTIVKQPRSGLPGHSQIPTFLASLITYASPLKEATVADIRSACLATLDQNLFHALRKMPEIYSISTVNQMLLGTKTPPDDIEVEDDLSNVDSFIATIVIPKFHRRMMVSKEIEVEFIAKGRLWRILFFIMPPSPWDPDPPFPPGSWCVSVSLHENSPPTHLDARFFIEFEASLPESAMQTPGPSLPPSQSPSASPPNSICMWTRRDPLIPTTKKASSSHRIVQSIDKMLQRSNNPYIGPDESLRTRLEAKLAKRQQ